MKKREVVVMTILAAASVFAQTPHIQSASAARYATDAYPGFDNESEILEPERKEPKWFAFINGPNRETAAEQFAYCQQLMLDGNFSKACKHLDALVREWPTSPEAPKAQQHLAELLSSELHYYDDAFDAYRYLLDFYSLQCDYNKMADELYKIAGKMREEGKEVMFIRFANTVDVRRAYEACVLHAPGADWVTEAMLIIGSLREDEGKLTEAVKVYENLRNLHPETPAAKEALLREAKMRAQLLEEHGYNRLRCKDTIDFLKLALKNCRKEDEPVLKELLASAEARIESEAFKGAQFYDSPTRTYQSAVNAYERFLREYPDGPHAEAARSRLEELKGVQQ